MSIISQRDDSKELTNTISAFFTNYKIGDVVSGKYYANFYQ